MATAETAMLIRKSPAEVFEAFADPAVTTRFWFTRGSERLEPHRTVKWSWEMFGVSIPVTVRSIEPGRHIVIEWPSRDGSAHTVEWRFLPHEGGTFVEITESGFTASGDELVRQVADSTQGFTLVLAGAKAWLEHGIALNLVPDRFPKGLTKL